MSDRLSGSCACGAVCASDGGGIFVRKDPAQPLLRFEPMTLNSCAHGSQTSGCVPEVGPMHLPKDDIDEAPWGTTRETKSA